MAPTKKRRCADCRLARDNGHVPSHVVHPVTKKFGVYDIHGIAVCPKCGAKWRRDLNRAELVE